jgi:hypothetical protein
MTETKHTPGEIITVNVPHTFRWHPYKPASEQYRRGKRGRWQEANEYGGWDNTRWNVDALLSEGRGDLMSAASTSYGKHCTNPVEAAEADLLGEALEVLSRLCVDGELTGLDKEAGWDAWFAQARAILSKTKRAGQ